MDDGGDVHDDLGRRLLIAARGAGEELAPLVHDTAPEVLRALAANPALEEEDLLVLLGRHDLPADLLRQVAGDATRTRSYRVRLALLRNHRTPASASLKFVPHLFLMDLVTVALIPHVPREVKAAIEGAILAKLKEVPLGLRIALARRTGSLTVLERLLVDTEAKVVEAALTNSRMNEGLVIRALRSGSVRPHTVDLVSRSPKWSVRHDVRYALLRNRYTPTARAIGFLATMTRQDLTALVRDGSVPPQLKNYLKRMLASGGGGPVR